MNSYYTTHRTYKSIDFVDLRKFLKVSAKDLNEILSISQSPKKFQLNKSNIVKESS